MKETELIQIALMLTSPWKVAECQFDVNRKRLAPSMTVKRTAERVPEHDTRLWRLLHHHVKEAREQVDYSDVKQVGIDETSSKRGHNYVTLAVDLNESKTIFATEGKDSATIGLFKDDLTKHGGDRDVMPKTMRLVAGCTGQEYNLWKGSDTDAERRRNSIEVGIR